MSENINKLHVDPTILTNLLKMLQENATVQRLKSKLTNEELHLINKDINRTNKYGANGPMRNVYKEAAEARANTYLKKQQRSSGNLEQNAKEEEPRGQGERKIRHRKRTNIKRKIDPKRNKTYKIGRIKVSKWEKIRRKL